jgi:pyrimidine and pyridine-specific 5'-nucleotidase
LYPKSMKIHDMMVVKIQQYFKTHLKISDEEANKLHKDYYQSYGLALEGLVRHHRIGILLSISLVYLNESLSSFLHMCYSYTRSYKPIPVSLSIRFPMLRLYPSLSCVLN